MFKCATLIATLFLSTSAFAQSTADTLIVEPDGKVSGSINSQPISYQMVANGMSTLILNPGVAKQLGIKPGMIGMGWNVGPVSVPGLSAVVRYIADGQESKRRVAWFNRPIAPGFDGQLGPLAVPHANVMFKLRPAQPGEQDYVLPMHGADNKRNNVGTMIMVGGEEIRILWDLIRDENMATAGAAADLATHYGAQFKGDRVMTPIAMGVERPVQPLILAKPFAVGPLSLRTILARVSDFGDTSQITDANAPVTEDASEIVVTAKGKKDRIIRTITIGRNDMKACSSIKFDKTKEQIILSCKTG